MKITVAFITLFIVIPNITFAEVLFEHTGTTDPTTEGWSANIGVGNTVGPIINDLGTRIDAWFTNDDSTAAGSLSFYSAIPTDDQITQGNTNGWKLSARLRVVDVPDIPHGTPIVLYSDGVTSYQMAFGSNEDGDPIIILITDPAPPPLGPFGGPSVTLEGSGSTYHLYELIYDPVAGSADFFVDGVERISDFTGFTSSAKEVGWGAGSSADTGQANYNLVRFEIEALTVAIDIKPGSDPNCFNIDGHGIIPVAILGSAVFDAGQINNDILSFAGLTVRVRGNQRPQCALEYSNADEFLDLVCHFEDEPANWQPGSDDSAELTGELANGAPFRGSDTICVVP